MTHPTDQLIDRRSGEDRRRDDDPAAGGVSAADPIAAWHLTIPPDLADARCADPWLQVVHRSLLAELDGEHEEVSRGWDDSVTWELTGPDPTTDAGPHVGATAIIRYHRELARRSDWTFTQELVSLEGGRGPIVEAHLRTTATRTGRTLDTPTLLVFELASLRVRKVTEIPGDLKAWEAFWRD